MILSHRAILAAATLCCMLNTAASPLTPKPIDQLESHELAAQYRAYPYTYQAPPALTDTPDGYEPFHIEQYARHGSRWLIDQKDYDLTLAQLEKAERNNVLTPLGKETLAYIRDITGKEKGRREELTDMGALQHQRIGARMVKNFPEVFAPGSNVDAKATIVIRCILSMVNEINSINKLAPGVNMTTDASYADMYYMNFDDTIGSKIKDSIKKNELRTFTKKYPETGAYLKRLISSKKFIKDSIESKGLERRMWRILSNAQSHIGMPWLTDRVFTKEELLNQWRRSNASWFIDAGISTLTDHKAPFSQRNLLRNIIESADTALTSPKVSANLRFGHDGMVLPLTVLMEINDYAKEINRFEDLENEGWYCQDIVPMAANIQMIFYRPKGSVNPDDVLVKVLLNENETTLPGEPVTGPYYNWRKLRQYYLDKINAFKY